MTDEDIELAVDWTGENGEFVQQLEAVGFVDGCEGSRVVHDWAEHNPWAAGSSARSEKSRWAALCKQHGGPEGAARLMPEYAERLLGVSNGSVQVRKSGATGMPPALPDSASGMHVADSGSAPSPSPSPDTPLPPKGAMEQRQPDKTDLAGSPLPAAVPAKQPKGRTRAPPFDAAAVPLPGWLPAEAWAMWVRNRAAAKKPVTEDAARLQLKGLGKLRTEGHDPVKVIENAIATGWQGLYPGNNGSTLADGARNNARAGPGGRLSTQQTGFAENDYTQGIENGIITA